MTLRLIEGGRASADAPGLLIHGASQVATLAGGIRRGASQDDLGLLDAAVVGGPGSAAAPVVACWEGRIVAAGPRDLIEQGREANGMPLARFVRIDADGGPGQGAGGGARSRPYRGGRPVPAQREA